MPHEKASGLTPDLRKVKLKRKLRKFLELTIKNTAAPFTDHSAAFHLLSLPFFFFAVLAAQGVTALEEETQSAYASLKAAVFALPLFLTYNAIRAAFLMRAEEKVEGEWFGNTFVYKQPPVLLRTRVSNSDNGKVFELPTAPAEPNSGIELKIEVEGLEQRRLQVYVSPMKESFLIPRPKEWVDRGGNSTVLTWAGSGTIFMTAVCETGNRSIVTISLLSWTVQ